MEFFVGTLCIGTKKILLSRYAHLIFVYVGKKKRPEAKVIYENIDFFVDKKIRIYHFVDISSKCRLFLDSH